jgi:hypothetical protein
MAATSLAHTVAEVAAEVEAGKNSHLRQVGEGQAVQSTPPHFAGAHLYCPYTSRTAPPRERRKCVGAVSLLLGGTVGRSWAGLHPLLSGAAAKPIDFCLGIEKSRLSTRLLSTSHPSHQPPSSKGAEVSSLTSTLLFLHLPPSLSPSPPHPKQPRRLIDRSLSRTIDSNLLSSGLITRRVPDHHKLIATCERAKFEHILFDL